MRGIYNYIPEKTMFLGYILKVKQFHYRYWQALRVPGVWGSQILRKSAHEGGKVVSPTHRRPLPQEIFLVLISVRGWVDRRTIVRQKGVRQWKKSSDTVGNRTHDLPVCSAVPQPLRHRMPPIVYSPAAVMWLQFILRTWNVLSYV
jgi:hypothetical protein